MISIAAADLTVNARGTTIETDIPVGSTAIAVYGYLDRFATLGEFVNLTLDGTEFLVPKTKPLRIKYEDARAWLLREDDPATRNRLLDAIADHNGQALAFT